jgi:hypothetical protein
MGRNRIKSDGLPYRLYQRCGSHVYSIGYKAPDGKWAFRLKCAVGDRVRIAECRREAIQRAATLNTNGNDGAWTFADMCEKWIEWQRAIPDNYVGKRAQTTLHENLRELTTLKKAFGSVRISDITKADGYRYLDACLLAIDETGNPRPRAEKGNKEISLARAVFEFAIRQGQIGTNPFTGIQKVGLEKPEQRCVTDDELDRAVKVGREMGGAYHIMALCLNRIPVLSPQF